MQTLERTTGQMVVVVQPQRDDVPSDEIPTIELRVHVKSTVGGKLVEGELPSATMLSNCAWLGFVCQRLLGRRPRADP